MANEGDRPAAPPMRTTGPRPMEPMKTTGPRPMAGAQPGSDRTAAAFSTDLVLGILLAAGTIQEQTRRDVLAREPAQRGRVLKEAGGGKLKGPRYVVSPIELVASLKLPDLVKSGGAVL